MGIYNIIYKYGIIMNILLVMTLSMGNSPYMYRIDSLNSEHKFFTDIMFYYAVLGSLIVLIFSIAAHPMIEFFSTKDYLVAAGIVPIISFAYLISGFRTFFTIGIALNNKTKIVGLIASAGIVINILLNYILIKKYLLMGAAWATVISYMVITLMYYIAARKIAKIDWGVPRLIKLMFNLLIAICFVYLNNHYHYYSQLIGGTLIIVLFIFLLIISNTISNRDINGIKYLLKKIFKLQ